jgi:hypothetical protein
LPPSLRHDGFRMRPGRVGEGGNPLAGLLLVGRGRREGIALFGGSANAYLASLAPLIAFPLVGSFLLLISGGGLAAVTDFLEVICALLGPAVFSHVLARHWKREAEWLRFATAFNWCQWLMPVVLLILLVVLGVALQAGLPRDAAGAVALGGLALYALWLHWFLARHGLALSTWRAVAMVAWVNVGTLVLLLAPRLVLMGLDRGS